MVSSLLDIAAAGGAIIATWWLHSTLLIGGTWLLLKYLPRIGHREREIAWKTAAVAGFFTTALQVSSESGTTIVSLEAIQKATAHVGSPSEHQTTDAASNRPARSRSHALTPHGQLRDALAELTDLPELHLPDSKPPTIVRPLTESAELQGPAPGMFDSLAAEERTPKSDSVSDPGPIPANPVNATRATSTTQPRLKHHFNQSHSPSDPPVSLLKPALASLFGLWCVGVLAGLLRIVRERRLLGRHLAVSEPARRNLIQRFDALLKEARVARTIELRVSNFRTEPAATGFLRPTIILPAEIEARLQAAELKAVLLHEVAHVVRGDLLWLQIGRLLVACLGLQPLHRVAFRQWQLSAEFQCDYWAITHEAVPTDLARGLTLVAEWRAEGPAFVGGAAAGGHHGHVSDRVELLLSRDESHERRRFRMTFSTWALVATTSASVALLGPNLLAPGQSKAARPEVQPPGYNRTTMQLQPPHSLSGSRPNQQTLETLQRETDGLRVDIRDLLAELRVLAPSLRDLDQDSQLRNQARQLIDRLRAIEDFAGSNIPTIDELQPNNRPQAHSHPAGQDGRSLQTKQEVHR